MSSTPPISQPEAKRGDIGLAASRSARTTRSPKRILVVEDDELNMRVFHDLLDSQGFETIESRDGRTAWEMARVHSPDLVLLDVQLPGMSGLELTRRLKSDSRLSSVPVVAVTAFAMKRDEQRIRDSGCDAYVTKPFSIQTLLNVIDNNIDHDEEEEDDDDTYLSLGADPHADVAREENKATRSNGDGEQQIALEAKHNSTGAHGENGLSSDVDIPPIDGELRAPGEEPAREWTIAEGFDESAAPQQAERGAPPPDIAPAPDEGTPVQPVPQDGAAAAPESVTDPAIEKPQAGRSFSIWPSMLFWPNMLFMGALAATALWPGNFRSERTPNLYVVEFVDDVVDLSIGSPVRRLGTNVGKVTQITVNPENQNRVHVVIELAPHAPINRETTAALRHENLVGAAYVELSGGDWASPPLKSSPGQLTARIPVAPSQSEPVMGEVSQLFARAALLVNAVARVLDDSNARAMADSLENVRLATSGLAEASDKVDGLISESVSATVALRETVQQIDALASRFEREITSAGESGKGVSTELGATVAELYRAASALNHAVADLDAIAIDNRRSLRELYARGLTDGSALSTEIRALVSRLTTIVAVIEINGGSSPASGSPTEPSER